MKLADDEARLRIQRDLDETLVVEAAAGTGKTTALVRRIVALVAAGRTTLRRIVAVTFTDKAAGEMKLRLRGAIEKALGEARAAADVEVVERFERALAELEATRIATIHSLCLDILRERPVEARIDPLFEIAPEPDARRLFDLAFDSWFAGILADPPEGVRRLLRRPSRDEASRPRNVLRAAGWSLADRRDFRGPWRRDPFARELAIDALVARLDNLGARLKEAKSREDNLAKNLDEIRRWTRELEHRESVRERDHDGLEAELRGFVRWRSWTWKGWPGKFGPTRDDVLAERDAVKLELEDLIARCDADLAACLYADLQPLIAAYVDLKTRAGQLDFFDLLHETRELLGRDAAVRADLQTRFTHVLVDEFQDTDPLQAEIVLLLAAADPAVSDPALVRVKPGKLFLVGDPKQSIYRFRRADVVLYEALKQRLIDDGARLLHLSTSFRSDPRIQRFVNAAFAPVMKGGGQAEYVPLSPFRFEVAERPAVISLAVPRPYAPWGGVTKYAIEDSIPDAVAAWIQWLVGESGWTVSEPDAEAPVPVQARHVCLLFRRFSSWGRSVTAPFAQALENRRVPHVLVGGRSFHDREEIIALRNALMAIEWPDDELMVYATLRGPLFAVGDDALLAWRERFRNLDALRRRVLDPTCEELEEVAGALAVLRDLHRARNTTPLARTVSTLLERTRAHAGLALWSAGEQVLANVLKVAATARRFEARGASSFRAFVEHLEDEAAHGEAGEAPVVEQGTEGVRMMTVHRAKGLEFPVVIICDITANATSSRPSRHVDKEAGAWFEPLAGCVPVELLENRDEVLRLDRDESDRVLYVAATRARDVLVVPVVGDPVDELMGEETWTVPLEAVLQPPIPSRQSGAAAPGCPELGEDSVVDRPYQTKGTGPNVRPGRYGLAGGVDLVWWDPAVLSPTPPPVPGIRHQQILVEDDGGERAVRSQRRHLTWRDERERRIVASSVPHLRVMTPTEGPAVSSEGLDIRWDATEVERDARPRGKRFGALVHAVLAVVDAADDEAVLTRLVRAHARLVGASAAEIEAARLAVRATLDHPLLERSRRSPDRRPEAAVTWVSPGGEFVEGTVDLAFREPDEAAWTVVEYKTTADRDEDRAAYEVQVACYVRALAHATGEPVRGVILVV